MIETPRLVLRPHILEDFEPWFSMFSDPELFRFIGFPNLSREDAWNRLLRYAGHWSLLDFGMFAVVEKATNRFFGEVGLADFHRGLGPRFDGYPEAAWIMLRSAQGRGLALEAVTACHKWFDEQRGPARTVCIIKPHNEGSLRLASKVGYRPFGDCVYKQDRYIILERQ
jgi:RimJ/RimL family protein N-acetyltransferase